ncbi:MAG: hypothetical protein M1815_002862 [Lichina confinis]|nr:MAG: hypothetical protein M1815_002862 [Lichina confinis]
MERATSLLSPSQPRTFKLWHRVYRLEMERARTTNGVIISAIRTTDFDCHASRGTLDRLIDSVSLTLIAKRDAYIPYRLAVEISIVGEGSPGPPNNLNRDGDSIEYDEEHDDSVATTFSSHDDAPLRRPVFKMDRIYVSAPTPANDDDERKAAWAATGYLVVVDVQDRSVWMLYEAWHAGSARWGRVDIEPEDSFEDPLPTHSRFRPEHELAWGRLNG